MSDAITDLINGTELKKGRAIGVSGHALDVELRGRSDRDEDTAVRYLGEEFELSLRAPGDIRMLQFAMRQPKGADLAIRKVPPREVAVMFVEEDPEGTRVARRFVLLPTGNVVTPSDGYRARWRASTLSVNTGTLLHLFELEMTVGGHGSFMVHPWGAP